MMSNRPVGLYKNIHIIEKIHGLVDKFSFLNNAEKAHHVQIQYNSNWYMHNDMDWVRTLPVMKIEMTTNEVLATCCTLVASTDKMSSMEPSSKAVNMIEKISIENCPA